MQYSLSVDIGCYQSDVHILRGRKLHEHLIGSTDDLLHDAGTVKGDDEKTHRLLSWSLLRGLLQTSGESSNEGPGQPAQGRNS